MEPLRGNKVTWSDKLRTARTILQSRLVSNISHVTWGLWLVNIPDNEEYPDRLDDVGEEDARDTDTDNSHFENLEMQSQICMFNFIHCPKQDQKDL